MKKKVFRERYYGVESKVEKNDNTKPTKRGKKNDKFDK